MKNNRPYKYDSRDRIKKNKNKITKKNVNDTQYVKKNSSKKNDKKINTNIVIDMNMINDSKSLDTSFLEGRLVKPNKKKKIENDKSLKTSNEELIKIVSHLRKIFLSLIIILVIFLIIMFSVNTYNEYYEKWNNNGKDVDIDNINLKKVIDDNYLFVGCFHTNNFDFVLFDLDYHYIKSFGNNKTTLDLIGDMKKYIYDYNPSIIFLELGLSDIKSGITYEDSISNIEEIIDLILKNRPYAKVYVESFYPINKEVENYDVNFFADDYDNKMITDINKKLKKVTSNKNVSYLDMYSVLEKDGVLNSEFTDDGIHLNKEGYNQVFKVIKKVVG